MYVRVYSNIEVLHINGNKVLADALPQSCLTSKGIMLKLLSLSSKAIV